MFINQHILQGHDTNTSWSRQLVSTIIFLLVILKFHSLLQLGLAMIMIITTSTNEMRELIVLPKVK